MVYFVIKIYNDIDIKKKGKNTTDNIKNIPIKTISS